ncbi:MAG: class I SAM-dependent methyltransferase [Rhizobiaceae bacterium]|nr:class I SAM-dependent methyltransferase [Rhizobiaceae bacterium]
MTRDALKTLFHPFASGELALPSADATVLFLGAEPGFSRPEGFPANLHLVQGFRPHVLALQAQRHAVTPTPPDGAFDVVLVLSGRHRGKSELDLADALDRAKPDALILVAGAKDDGIATVKRHVETLLPVAGSMPKFHGLVFWFVRPPDAHAVAAILRAENPAGTVAGGFRTQPGMFSHGTIDAGSRLLAEHLPPDLSGRVADFCAGWGYLARAVADRCPGAKSIDLYEADFASIEAARDNLAGLAIPVGFFWHDLLSEPVAERYDAIVMNPPFHRGRAGEPSIGQGMIRAASAALRKGGRLLLVANRQLPYEETLAAAFASVEQVADGLGFKVIVARR